MGPWSRLRGSSRGQPAPTSSRGCLLALACCGLAVAVWDLHGALAFSHGPPASVAKRTQAVSSVSRASHLQALDARVATASVAPAVLAPSSSANWQGIGCAAFLLAMTLGVVSPKQARGSGRQARRDFVVACRSRPQAFDGISMQKVRAEDTAPVLAVFYQTTCTNFLTVAHEAAAMVTSAAPADSLMGLSWDEPISATRQASSSRFAGGARVRMHRHASKSRGSGAATQRAIRRCAGAKLQQALRPEARPASYDSSRLRKEIQVGLRTLTRIQSECVREVKILSSAKGSRISTGLHLDGEHFKLILKYVTS